MCQDWWNIKPICPFLGEALDPGYGLPTINEVYTHITNKRVDKVRKMYVIDIVDLDALNFSITYMDIKSIEIKRKSILSPKGRRIIDLVTKSKKYLFRIVEEKAFKEGISLLKKILPQKAEVP